MERVDILGVKVSAANGDKAVDYLVSEFNRAKGNYICVSNVHTTVMAKENAAYRDIQNNSFMSLPDGKPLSIIGQKRGYDDMGRVTGPDFMETVFIISIINNWSHYFYGNTGDNLNKLIHHLKRMHPGLDIKGYQPSVFRELTVGEKRDLLDEINRLGPDFVWVGLGAPRQEVFCSEMCPESNSVWVGVGGAFNVLCGIIPRAPLWMQKYCLEWFYRLLQEPRRLFIRYFVTNLKFIVYYAGDR